MRKNFGQGVRELRSLMSNVGDEFVQEPKHPKQRRHDENTAITILDVGRVNNRVQQEAHRTTDNVPLLALAAVRQPTLVLEH
jgi:hypothetical protein